MRERPDRLARVQRRRDRDAVRRRRRLRAHRRTVAAHCRRGDGGIGQRAGGSHDGARRLASCARDTDRSGDAALDRRRSGHVQPDPGCEPKPPGGSEAGGPMAWSFGIRVHLPGCPTIATTHNPQSRPTAAGSTSRRATTTKTSTRARSGSATTWAAARRCVGADADPRRRVRQPRTASRLATRARELGIARALQRRRIRFDRRVGGPILLQLVGAGGRSGGMVSQGLVTQRTRVYQTERDIQRGLFVGVSFWHFETTAYVLNPDDSEPTVVVSVGLSF